MRTVQVVTYAFKCEYVLTSPFAWRSSPFLRIAIYFRESIKYLFFSRSLAKHEFVRTVEANLSIHDWNECVCVFFIVICPVKVIFPERLNIYSVPQISFLDVFVGFSHHICELCHIFVYAEIHSTHVFLKFNRKTNIWHFMQKNSTEKPLFCSSIDSIHRVPWSSTRRANDSFPEWLPHWRSYRSCICCIWNEFAANIQLQHDAVWTRTRMWFWKREWQSKCFHCLSLEMLYKHENASGSIIKVNKSYFFLRNALVSSVIMSMQALIWLICYAY